MYQSLLFSTTNNKKGTFCYVAEVPFVATIFSCIYHQGTSSSSIVVFDFGVSLYAPNAEADRSARVATIAMVVG